METQKKSKPEYLYLVDILQETHYRPNGAIKGSLEKWFAHSNETWDERYFIASISVSDAMQEIEAGKTNIKLPLWLLKNYDINAKQEKEHLYKPWKEYKNTGTIGCDNIDEYYNGVLSEFTLDLYKLKNEFLPKTLRDFHAKEHNWLHLILHEYTDSRGLRNTGTYYLKFVAALPAGNWFPFGLLTPGIASYKIDINAVPCPWQTLHTEGGFHYLK